MVTPLRFASRRLLPSVAFLNGTTAWSGGVATAASTGTTGGMFKGSLPATALATTLAASSVSA